MSHSYDLNSQDLSMLENLGVNSSSVPTGQSFEDDSEEEPARERNDVRRDYTNKNYGFTGGRNFITPPKSKFYEQPLEHFGYSYFTNQSMGSKRPNSTPIPNDYVIGPQDELDLILFGVRNEMLELIVSREGEIYLPEIGPLTVAGLSFQDLKKLIQETIRNQLIGTDANVTLGTLRSIDVFLLGSVNQPGLYNVSGLSTITNAIAQSGGIDPSGSLREIKLKRKGEIIATFDFYDLLIDGDTSSDLRLMQGDVIFVETIGRTAAVQGEVNRSGIFEMKEDENLSDLLSFAGKTTAKANLRDIDITRIDSSNNSFELLSIDLIEYQDQEIEISNGDVVSIYSLADNLKNAVLVRGHARQPGFYSYSPDMKLLDLIKGPEDLLENTDINYAILKRKDKVTQSIELFQIDFEELFASDKKELNFTLKEKDELILLPSMLNADEITTTIIKDEFIFNESINEMIPVDEWTSISYLRKSLIDNTIPIVDPTRLADDLKADEIEKNELEVLFEYSIYDYCMVPENIARMVIEDSGFEITEDESNSTVENLNSNEDLKLMQERLDSLSNDRNSKDSTENISDKLTELCRNQLLDPIIEEIKRKDSDDRLGIISVFGNVHFPGVYPFTKNMILSDAIKASGGLKNGTYDAEIELTSINNAGKTFKTKNNFASYKEVNNINLQKMDTVNFKQLSSTLKTVEITGEVFFPGTYPISENETIAELIKRAGGVTDYGSLKAAFFQRKSLKQAEASRLKSARAELRRKIVLSSQSGGLGQESLSSNSIAQLTSLITGDTEEAESLGRLVIDLERILNGSAKDVTLEDGDTINIPIKKQSVSVLGEVFVPNSHLFQDDYTINDYISMSGGKTTFADESNIYLIKSDGSIISQSQLSSGFFRANNSILEPGDTIIIPLQVQPFSGIKATTEVTQIIYQMALAAAAVNSF